MIQCQKLQGLAANTIIYYLYPNSTALANGLRSFLKTQKFKKAKECTTKGACSEFIVNCESDFTIKTPGMTGSIVEYAALTGSTTPIIVNGEVDPTIFSAVSDMQIGA